jgi:hypothetical protein
MAFGAAGITLKRVCILYLLFAHGGWCLSCVKSYTILDAAENSNSV